jgi:hypothetical protein
MTRIKNHDTFYLKIFYHKDQKPYTKHEILEMLQSTPLWKCRDIEIKDLLPPQKPIRKRGK